MRTAEGAGHCAPAPDGLGLVVFSRSPGRVSASDGGVTSYTITRLNKT